MEGLALQSSKISRRIFFYNIQYNIYLPYTTFTHGKKKNEEN